MHAVIHDTTTLLGMQATFIRRNRIIRYFGMTASFVLFLITILTAFPIVIKDDETRAAASKASDTVLAMTTGNETASVDIVADNDFGAFAFSDSTKTAKFGVTTNNYTGYTLTIAGTDDTGLLTNTDTSITTNNTLSSISSATSADTFSSSTALNGKWGYQPSKYNSTTNTSFLPAPTTTASILDATGTANPTTPNNYTIGVGARVAYGKPSGVYANTFVLAVVGNPVGYSITYSDDTGDTSVANLPTTQSGVSASTSAILNPSSTPTRTGYTFKSWCLGTVSDNGTTCTGTEYVSGDTIDFIDQTINTNTADLYAVWDVNTYSLAITFDGTGVSSVQVRTEAGSGGTLIGTVSTSGDSISGLAFNATYYLYPVFSDGYGLNSWDNTGSYGTISSTSDTNPTFTMGAGNGAVTITSKFNGTALYRRLQDGGVTMQEIGSLSQEDKGSLVSQMDDGISYDSSDERDGQIYTIAKVKTNVWMTRNLAIGCDGSGSTYGSSANPIALTGELSNISSPWSTPTARLTTRANSSASAGYDTAAIKCNSTYGAWYNYAAASAGTITGSSNTGTQLYDICPKGWKLPTIKEIRSLAANVGDDSIPYFNPIGGGYYLNGSISSSSKGLWWGGGDYTAGSTIRYGIQFDARVGLNYTIKDSYYGLNVRCVLDTSTPYEKLKVGRLTMQDIGELATDDKSPLLSWMIDISSYKSTDERDGQVYTVAKIDNKIWMNKNLAIGCDGNGSTYGSSIISRSLTSNLSNISSAWSTPTESLGTVANSSATSGYDTAAILCNSTYGAWYNYAAATAGTITGNSNGDTQEYDICPKGWRLPTKDEFSRLMNDYYYTTFTTANPATGGYIREGSIIDPTTIGAYWSSTLGASDDYRYYLYYSNSALALNNDYRYYGFYVRCVTD